MEPGWTLVSEPDDTISWALVDNVYLGFELEPDDMISWEHRWERICKTLLGPDSIFDDIHILHTVDHMWFHRPFRAEFFVTVVH